MSQLLSVEEVCEVLDCRPSKLYRLMRERKISFRRIGKGGQPKFTQADLDEFIANAVVPAVHQ